MLSPFAPHTAEELWQMLGHPDGAGRGAAGRRSTPAVAKAEEVVVPVQVNGKVRARLTVPADASEDELRELALADPAVQAHTDGKTIRKVVVAKGPLVSVVVSMTGHRRAPMPVESLCARAVVPVRCSAARAAATRWPAAARSCPTTSRRSASRRSPTARPSSTSRRMLTEKVRAEFIGRGKYQIVPDATRRRRAC